jgi:hypothetical protein
LVVGYFGQEHSAQISYYFTDIIRTHTLIHREDGEGKITIPSDIDLTYLTQQLSIRAGTKKKGRRKGTKRVKF